MKQECIDCNYRTWMKEHGESYDEDSCPIKCHAEKECATKGEERE